MSRNSENRNSLNTSLSESEQRKQKYKDLLEIGVEGVKNQENSSVVDNFELLTNLILQSNELLEQGNIQDRVGQSSEVVLDVSGLK